MRHETSPPRHSVLLSTRLGTPQTHLSLKQFNSEQARLRAAQAARLEAALALVLFHYSCSRLPRVTAPHRREFKPQRKLPPPPQLRARPGR